MCQGQLIGPAAAPYGAHRAPPAPPRRAPLVKGRGSGQRHSAVGRLPDAPSVALARAGPLPRRA
eukprot:8676858-Alexandrium_andersonii.AAC.1